MKTSNASMLGKRGVILAVAGLALALASGPLLFAGCDNPVLDRLVYEQALYGRWNNPTHTVADTFPRSQYWDIKADNRVVHAELINASTPVEAPYQLEKSWEEGGYLYYHVKSTTGGYTYLFLIRITEDREIIEMNYRSSGTDYPSSLVVGVADYVKMTK